MTRHFKTFTLLSLSILLFACGNSPSGEHSDEIHKDDHITKKDSIALSHNTDEIIELNNGEKWMINDEMKPFIAQGEAALNDYISSGSTDYKALASKLKDADSKLISSCTMDGKSHDELHKWLHPHLELVNELDASQNEQEANNVVQKLKKSYENFWIYFQ